MLELPAVRYVNREPVVLLGGGRALLMQVAHPLVARGVREHSDYRRDRFGRLLGTLRPMFAIAYGSEAQAHAAAVAVRTRHEGVRGSSYRASDPALLAWVLATLIDTALLMYGRFVRPLPEALADRYYAEMLTMGELLGMPRDALPPTRRDFDAYVAAMVGTLEVTDDARAITRDLFGPLPGTGPALPLAGVLTAGLLPPRLREAYGLAWGPGRAAMLQVAAALSRRTLPLLPRPFHRPPRLLLPPAHPVSERSTGRLI